MVIEDLVVDFFVEKEVDIDEDFTHVYQYVRFYSGRFERFVTTKFRGGVQSFLERNKHFM